MVEAGVEQVAALLAGSPGSEGERSCTGYRRAKQLVSVGQISDRYLGPTTLRPSLEHER